MIDQAHFEIINKENVGLANGFSVNPSSCENSAFYKEYLQWSALSDLYAGRTTTHLFIDELQNRIMGFVALRASAIISRGDGESVTGIPAMEVFMLAVDKDYEGRRVGTALIDYVIYQASLLHEEHIGLQYIILAADKKAIGFYEKMSFVPLEKPWNRSPKENRSVSCAPMSLLLDFEKNHTVSYADDE